MAIDKCNLIERRAKAAELEKRPRTRVPMLAPVGGVGVTLTDVLNALISLNNETIEVSDSLEIIKNKVVMLSSQDNAKLRKLSSFVTFTKNLIVSNQVSLVDIKGQGNIKELIVSLNAKPNITITTENFDINATFDELVVISEYAKTITAITDTTGSNYIVVVKDLTFLKNAKVTIQIDIGTTMNSLFCVYDMFSEVT